MIFCAGEFYEYPIGYSFALLALSMALYPHKELVCTVKKEASKELKQYLKKYPAEGISVLVKTEENCERLSKCAPFTAGYPVPEMEARYYICENGACKMPAAFDELEKYL